MGVERRRRRSGRSGASCSLGVDLRVRLVLRSLAPGPPLFPAAQLRRHLAAYGKSLQVCRRTNLGFTVGWVLGGHHRNQGPFQQYLRTDLGGRTDGCRSSFIRRVAGRYKLLPEISATTAGKEVKLTSDLHTTNNRWRRSSCTIDTNTNNKSF